MQEKSFDRKWQNCKYLPKCYKIKKYKKFKKHIDIYVFFVYNVNEIMAKKRAKERDERVMDMSEINLSKIDGEEVLDIYNRTREFIEFLDNEIKTNEVEKK